MLSNSDTSHARRPSRASRVWNYTFCLHMLGKCATSGRVQCWRRLLQYTPLHYKSLAQSKGKWESGSCVIDCVLWNKIQLNALLLELCFDIGKYYVLKKLSKLDRLNGGNSFITQIIQRRVHLLYITSVTSFGSYYIRKPSITLSRIF